MISFSKANKKLKKLYAHQAGRLKKWLGRMVNNRAVKVYSFSLLSGWSCPMALFCKSRAKRNEDGKKSIEDGKHTKFRCFSASQEAQYDEVFDQRQANYKGMTSLKTVGEMVEVLEGALPHNAGIVRIHVAGDFFNETYFKAWIQVAKNNPLVLFYAYTKSLSIWIKNRSDVPYNMVMTASRGGREDHLIEQENLREARVVFSQEEADELGLVIDHDDSYACDPKLRYQDFALLIHGTQPKGSEAGKAVQKIKKASSQLQLA